jgi:hypothetical protein
MISEVDLQDMNNPWIPVYCDQCQESHKVLTLLGHRYVLTYCGISGKTLANDETIRIPRPQDCPLNQEGGDG